MNFAEFGIFVDANKGIAQLNQFTGSAHNAKYASGNLEKGVKGLSVAFRSLGAYFGTRQLVEYADTWMLIHARMRLVTKTEEEARTIQEALYNISQRTRNTMAATAVLYHRLALSANELGRSHADLLKVTESVNAGLLVSGSTGVEAAQSMRQLAQAFSKGKLDGDEFRTVMEAMPVVAQAIADELGVTRNALLELAPAGKITASQIVAALQEAHGVLVEAAAKMPVTIGQSFIQFANAAERMVGIIAMISGSTRSVSGVISGLARNMDKIVAVLGMITASWILYKIAVVGATIATKVLTAWQTISAFVSLARSIRTVADGMALLSMVGGGLAKLAIIIAVAAGGLLTYMKIIKEIEEATKLWSEANADLTKPIGKLTEKATEDGEDYAKMLAKVNAEISDMIRKSHQAMEIAGLADRAKERWEIIHDAINKFKEAERELAKYPELLARMKAAIIIEGQNLLKAEEIGYIAEKQREQLEEQLQIIERFKNNVQESFGDLFYNIMTKGISSFRDLWDSAKQMFFRMLAEMAAARMMQNIGARIAGLLAIGFGGTASAAAAQATPIPGEAELKAGILGEEPPRFILAGIEAQTERSFLGKMAQYLGPAIAGFGVGSAIGGMTSNPALGALGGAAGGAAAGALAGSVIPGVGTAIGAAVGALTGAIGGFMSASKRRAEEEAKLRQALENNRKALDKMRDAIYGRNVGQDLLDALKVTKAMIASGTSTANPQAAKIMEDMAAQLGLTLKGAPTWQALADAIQLAIRAITQFGNNLQDLEMRQNAYNKLFDVEMTPQQTMTDAYDILMAMAPDLMRTMGLANLDLTTQIGRDVLMEGLRDIFRLIDSGQLTPELLGSFSDKGQLLDSILKVVGAFEELHKELYKVTTDFPRAMDIIYYENKFGRYGEPAVTPTTPTAGIVVQGNLVIENTGSESGEEILDKVEHAALQRGARGGFVSMPLKYET